MGSWMDSDGLYRQYGVTKAVPTTAGDYLMYGETREIELTIDLTTLTTSPVIQANTTFFGEDTVLIESVEVFTEVAAVGGTSFSVGLVKLDRTTVISNTAFLAAVVIADHNVLGERTVYSAGIATAGANVGTVVADPGYITALAAGTYSAGRVKVRIKYRGVPPITQ